MIKQSFDRLYTEKAVGAQIRSRAKWIEDGEKSTAYFLNLEKRHSAHNVIESLKYKEKKSTDNQGILDICKDFYSELYSSKTPTNESVTDFVSSVNIERKLTNEERDICEGVITTKECDCAIKKMQKNKAPGLDGLTIEFYKYFWPYVKDIVVDAFNESYDLGCLPEPDRPLEGCGPVHPESEASRRALS